MNQKNSFRLELITPERVLIDQDVDFAVVPSGVGPIGILPGHAPLLGILSIGIMKVREAGNREFKMFVDRGFFKISHKGVTIIAQSAEPQDQVDTDRAAAARERAKNLLASGDHGIDMEQARDALLRAETRLQVSKEDIYYLLL